MPDPATNLDLVATCAFGLESVVARELAGLGVDAKPYATGRVGFQGDASTLIRANLWLRAADRVLIAVGRFAAPDFGVLFDATYALPWERWIPHDFAFPVDGRSVKSQLSSVPACQKIVKKAIVERLRSAHGVQTLPETGPTVRVEVALLKDQATLTIDTSGDGLHKRGYRPLVGEAALKETMAAGLVLLSNWRPERPLIDPFCGSGTIAIEAALIGRHIAPGLSRAFDAEQWPAFPPEHWDAVRADARALARPSLPITIHGSDIDSNALSLARAHAVAAGVERDVHFQRRDIADLESKAEYGVVIANPPYGVRLGDTESTDRLYAQLPTVFRRLPTWSFHILTARLDLERIFGQEATRRRKLYNSRIECTYFSFLGPKPPSLRREPAPESAPSFEPNASFDDGVELEGETPPDAAPEPVTPHMATAPLPAAFGGLRERDARELDQFASRLEKNARHLRRYPSRGVSCYRVYERDCPDAPLIIDVYDGAAHIAEYEREHSRSAAQQADWWDRVRDITSGALSIPRELVFTKEKHRQRGLTQHEKVADRRATRVVTEGGLKFEVNLSDYVDTGLFLDHRLTRAMVRDEARGSRFLNLFCYTGAFTVYAAAGGAASTTSVDLSNTYLSWARRNLELNNLWSPRHTLVREGVLEFLDSPDAGRGYTLAVVDPPTFSNSKSTEDDWEVGRDQADLFERLIPRMAPGAVIYFSNNYRRFKLDEEMLSRLGVTAREISNRTVPPEYRNRRIHRCWRLVVGG